MASRSPMRAQDARREAAKRRMKGNFIDDPSASASNNNDGDSPVDGSNPDHVRLLVEDLDAKFRTHLELLNADLFSLKNEQKSIHNTGMMKLPRSIRQMTVREFNLVNSCDLLSILKSKDGVQMASVGTAGAAAANAGFKKRDRMPVLETPAPTKFRAQNAPGTVLRTVRKGEAI